ncbi:MAG TPA: MFS transporter, partial [Caldithrix abyssi]|nr:MFS transporter [Caldithrix abyssi]
MEVLNTNETLTAATGPTTLSTAKRLFNKNYLLLWQGQFISRLGSQVYSVVIGFWLQQTTQSGSIVGAFFMMVGMPIVFFGIFGGALADRISRKKIIVGADIINGLLFVTLGVVMYFNQHQTDVLIAGVFVAGVLVSSVGAFFGPAISASVPDLVPPQKIQAANSMGQFSIRISAFFGQGAGIPLLHLLGLPILVLVNGITYLVSAFSESFITIPQKKREKVTGFSETLASFKKDLAEGLRYIGKNKGLKRLLTISVFLNFFTMPI